MVLMNPNTIADLNTVTTVCKEQINIILQKSNNKKKKKNPTTKQITLKQFTGFFACMIFNCVSTRGVSQSLLLNANSAIVQLDQDENKLICNEMMIRSALYYTNMLRNQSLSISRGGGAKCKFGMSNNTPPLFKLCKTF